eukprot:356023-Chlamydomonas_euryale.AAC.4
MTRAQRNSARDVAVQPLAAPAHRRRGIRDIDIEAGVGGCVCPSGMGQHWCTKRMEIAVSKTPVYQEQKQRVEVGKRERVRVCVCVCVCVHGRIVALMYAEDLALLADSPDDLVVLLDMVDAVTSKYKLSINEAKDRDYGGWTTHGFAYI